MPPPPKRDLPPYVHQTGPNTYEYRVNQPRRPDGTRPKPVRQGGFSDPYEAHRAAQAARRRIGLATPEEVEASAVTVGEWCDEWLQAQHHLASSTRYMYRRRVLFIKAGALSAIPIGRLTTRRAQQWFDVVAREHTPNVAIATRTILSTALRRAMAQGIIAANPVALVTIRGQTKRPRKILTPAELETFLAVAMDDYCPALWHVAVMLQLRAGELLALRWSDIDFKSGRVHIHRTLRRDEATGRLEPGEGAKTPSSNRYTTLSPRLITMLQQHQRAQRAEILQRSPYGRQWHDHDLVFPGQHGENMTVGTLHRWLHSLCDRAGVPRITPHGMRHSGTTWLRHLGVAPEVVARRLGHTSTRLVFDLYSNALPDEQEDASAALDQHLLDLHKKRTGPRVDTLRSKSTPPLPLADGE